MIVINIRREKGPTALGAPKEPQVVEVTLELADAGLAGTVKLRADEAVEHRVRIRPSSAIFVRIDGHAEAE